MQESAPSASSPLAESVERVFHDVVAGRADDMDEELAGEFAETEAARTARLSMTIAPALAAGSSPPIGEHLAVAVEQRSASR